MNDIQPIIKRKQLIGWTVQIDGQSVAVDLAELPAPAYPTEHQIRHTARCKLQGEPADRVAMAHAIDQAYEMALVEYERSEAIRTACVKRSGVDWRKAEKIINAYQDRTNVIDFDLSARTCAFELPELGWDPYADNGEALWEIVSAKPLLRPRRTDASVRNIAIGLLCFAPSAEAVPF